MQEIKGFFLILSTLFLGCSQRDVALNLQGLEERDMQMPQWVITNNGAPLLIWKEKAEKGADLFLSYADKDGVFSDPVRINQEQGQVEALLHEQALPAVAVASDGRIAVAWSDRKSDVRVAIAPSHDAAFGASIQLNQDDSEGSQTFPAIAFDTNDVLHGIWLDARTAGKWKEEPADIYLARLENGVVQEENLTDDASPSVCGCCRPSLDFDSGSLRAVFRNTDTEGFRDMVEVTATDSGEYTDPKLLGEKLWKITGCPMSGPVLAAGEILWNDGSTGKRRLMAYSEGDDAADAIAEEDENWSILASPRLVTGVGHVILLPGIPNGKLIAHSKDGWQTVEDAPQWASHAMIYGSTLHLIGSSEGKLRHESRPWKY